MKISYNLLRQITADLGLNVAFVKGQTIPVKNCWHFSTDGNAVEALFYDQEDFIDGMNRVYVVLKKYKVIILAFCLMDTHVHFVLYGEYDECNRFVHEFLRRTSMRLFHKYGKRGALDNLEPEVKIITDDNYLKTAICYDIRNAPMGGLRFNGYDYPWSSGALYFRCSESWTAPSWVERIESAPRLSELSLMDRRSLLKTMEDISEDVPVLDGMVFPGSYVAYEIVEQLFKTPKGFLYFMSKTKESDIDQLSGNVSRLSMPIQELRQHKREVCMELFGQGTIRNLDMSKRLRLARVLKSRYDSSPIQIAKMCGLIYREVVNML